MNSLNRTPLRRVSHGSLSALARSQSGTSASASTSGSTGLEFLAQAMSELSEEMEMMVDNMDGLNEIEASLDSFNEAFASYLYVMKMNTLCVEWPEAPTAASFLHRVEQLEREQSTSRSALPNTTTGNETTFRHGSGAAGEISYAVPSAPPGASSPSPPPATTAKGGAGGKTAAAAAVPQKKKKGKPQMSAKEKKARALWIDKLIALAPVDFRGNNPTLRKAAEETLDGLIEADKAVRPAELVKPKTLPPVMVNKCLIAFVAAKLVLREDVHGAAVYQLSELAYKDQPL